MREKIIHSAIQRKGKAFSEEEIGKIMKQLLTSEDYPNNQYGDWMRYRDINIVAFGFFLGLRPRCIAMVKFSDIDPIRKVLYVDKNANKLKKGRTVPIPDSLLNFVEKYLTFPKFLWKTSSFLFPSMENDHISTKRIEVIIREKALKPLGLYQKGLTSTYSLRHSFARVTLNRMIKKHGIADLNVLAAIMGHASVDTTAKFYLKEDDNYLDYMREQMQP